MKKTNKKRPKYGGESKKKLNNEVVKKSKKLSVHKHDGKSKKRSYNKHGGKSKKRTANKHSGKSKKHSKSKHKKKVGKTGGKRFFPGRSSEPVISQSSPPSSSRSRPSSEGNRGGVPNYRVFVKQGYGRSVPISDMDYYNGDLKYVNTDDDGYVTYPKRQLTVKDMKIF